MSSHFGIPFGSNAAFGSGLPFGGGGTSFGSHSTSFGSNGGGGSFSQPQPQYSNIFSSAEVVPTLSVIQDGKGIMMCKIFSVDDIFSRKLTQDTFISYGCRDNKIWVTVTTFTKDYSNLKPSDQDTEQTLRCKLEEAINRQETTFSESILLEKGKSLPCDKFDFTYV